MAGNSKTTKEKLREKYGITSNTSSQGKQTTSASPTNSKTTKEKLREKYGITNNTTPQTKQTTSTKGGINYGSAINLGLGPVSQQKVNSLIKSGEVKVDKNGAVSWIDQYARDTKKTYDEVTDKVNKKTTTEVSDRVQNASTGSYYTPSTLSDTARKHRLDQVKAELAEINKVESYAPRAEMYMTSEQITKTRADRQKKKEALSKELEALQGAKTYTGTEMKQREIDALIAQRNAIPDYSGARRISASEADTVRKAMSERLKLDNEIDMLERELDLYENIEDYSNDINKDNFGGQWSANYRSAELSRQADLAMSKYLYNPTEKNKEIAYAYAELARRYAENNSEALDDKNVSASWITKDLASYMPQFTDQIVPELVGYGVGALVGHALGSANVGGALGAGFAVTSASYPALQGSVYRTLLAEGVDHETALAASQDEALLSSLIEGGESAVSWALSGAVGKAWGAIGNAAKSSVAKGSTSVATKYIAKLASKEATTTATKPLWKKAAGVAFDLGKEAASEYGEEWLQQGVGIANRERALRGETGFGNLVSNSGSVIYDAVTGKNPEALSEMHEAGVGGAKIGLMLGGGRTVAGNVTTRLANAKTIKNQNQILDNIIKDNKTLNELIREGKDVGKDSKARTLAKEVSKAKKEGKVTRTQVKNLIQAIYTETPTKPVSKKVATEYVAESRKRNIVNSTYLDAVTLSGEKVSIDDVKKATGFGNHGAVLVSKLVDAESMTYTQAENAIKNAYLLGKTNIDGAKVNFETETQINAYRAGIRDRAIEDAVARANAKNATIYEGTFTENEYIKGFTDDEKKMVSTVAKHFKMDVSVVDEIIASVVKDEATGEDIKIMAGGEHQDGKLTISASSQRFIDKVVYKLVMHEVGHRIKQLAPTQFGALMDALYARSVRRNTDAGLPSTYGFDDVKTDHDRAGITLRSGEYLEEFAVRELEDIFDSAEAFNKWVAEIESNPQTKSAWERFKKWFKELINDLKRKLSGMPKDERAKAKAEIAELDRIMELLEGAYKGARDAATELEAKQKTEARAEAIKAERKAEIEKSKERLGYTKSSKSLEIKINEEYNGNESYSLYDSEVIFSSRYNEITQSKAIREMYGSAKKGNIESAYNLLSQLLGEEDINKVKGFGNDVYLLPVVGAEGTSTNVLPRIIAKHIGVKTGQAAFDGIYKTSSSDSRGTSIWDRMKENYPSFMVDEKSGTTMSDINGKKFVLVDDNSTTGRTFVGLRNFIEENGGEVVGYYALTTGQDQSEKMITTNETWNKLLDLGIDEVKAFAEREGIKREISKLGLTERETQELIKRFERENNNPGRGFENGTRSKGGSREIRAVHETEDGRGSNQEINYSLEGEDLNKLSTEEKKAADALGEGAKAITDKNGKMLIATNKDKSTVMYSLETYKHGGKDALEKALRSNGHTEEEIKETLSYVDDAADYLTILAAGYAKTHNYTALSNHLIADVITNVKTGKQVISAIVNNGDYPVNIDLALICKKRVAYMNLMNRLIDDGIFDKVNYNGEAIAKVNDLLRMDGFETACLGCFVESRRLQFQTWAETIVSEWNAEVDKRTENAGSFNFADGKAKLTDAELDALTEELKNAGKKNAQGNLNLGQGSVQTRMGRLLDKVPSLQKHLTVADLLKPEGLTALRAYDSNLFSLVKSRYGAASPKIVQDYNPYAGEIAMMTFSSVKNITSNAIKGADAYRRKVINEMGGRPTKQRGETKEAFNARKAEFNAKVEDEAMRRYLYDIGGARIQSFSDFMIENVFDYIQIFADLSAKRLPLHGYTKEIVALRLFGMTGAKWNGSLIAHVDRAMGKEYAGLLPASEAKDGSAILVHTKDGDFAIGFDDYARYKATNKKTFIQSIGMKDIVALQLDPRYSSYVGSITIGVSDKQILAMLDSPLFRFVIPYHSSGMLPQFAKLVGVDLYNDYTDYQNTTVKQWYDTLGNPIAPIKDGKGDTLKVDTSYNFNAEVQKTGDAKKAAANYLRWCGEQHPVYDGKKRVGYVTFNPKFSNSPYGTDFTKHENYYKLLEDFNVYDNITEASAVQGAVAMNFPSEANRLTATEMEAYKARLRETGLFSEKEIEKYSKIADKTFKELIADEVKGRADYQNAQAPKWEKTVKGVEEMLLGEYKREGKMNSLEGGLSNSELRSAITNNKLSQYVEEGKISTEKYNELIEKYGAIYPGENPHRDVEVPRKTGKGKKVSQTVRTVLEAEATPDSFVPTIEKMVEDGVFSYEVYSDKKAVKDADDYINEYGWDESLDDWFKDVEKGVVSKQHTVMGWKLYNNSANIAATTTSETERKSATEKALKILNAMIGHQRNAAQALQATRVFKKLEPETQLYGIQKSVNAFQKELEAKYGKKAPGLEIDAELAEQFLTAETQEERDEATRAIYKDIGRHMPSNWLDKWNAWRYLAMLGNPRTHIRNIAGNAFFAPVVLTKDLFATSIGYFAHKASKGKMQRSKALIWGSKADIALLQAAWNDYANVADLVSNGGKYNDYTAVNARSEIEEGRKIFKSKALAPVEWARKGNSKLLELEDVWFSKPHYAYALAQYCKANNITAEQIAKGKAIAPAREYAIKEAQKATYKDTNQFSQIISDLGRGKHKIVGVVVEGVLPFRKTPANILVRGVEYSPIGLLKGLSYDLYKVAKGEMMAHEAIDNISAGLTGTGLMMLGVYLAAQGLVRGHGEDDEDERKFKEMQGHQAYSLELPSGESVTLDWLAPEALPFFVGVNIWEATKAKDEDVTMSSILGSITAITEPMREMSCLQGVNDMIESVGGAYNNDTSGLMAMGASAVTSYLSQGVPTLLGQIERTSEEERMTTYTDKNDFLTGDMQYLLGKQSAKIPGWDYNQIPYIDAWGRKEASGSALKRGGHNFLNPAYTSKIESTATEKELLRLFDKTGEAGVFPERADKYFVVDGKRKDLTADEYVRYATKKGEISYKLVTELVESKDYKQLGDEEKVKAIKNAYDYANQKAKEAISRYKPQEWVKTADKFGSDAENYIVFKTTLGEMDKVSKEEYVDMVLDTARNDTQAWELYLSKYDSESAIKAEEFNIDAETFMNASAEMDNITADYIYNGRRVDGNSLTKEQRKKAKQVKGSREEKIKRYLNSVCTSEKDYLYLIALEYEKYKKGSKYVSYFGKE